MTQPQAPPKISFGWMMSNAGKIAGVLVNPKKFSKYWNDDTWGPHVHLAALLIAVFIMGVIIVGIQLAL